VKRRDFFRLGLKKTAEVVVEEAEARVEHRARLWIRPPYALNELDFLLKCTRCGDCMEKCPADVLFPLPAKYGLEVVSTPAMDLSEKGCRLCDDWPCVSACEPGALFNPPTDSTTESEEGTADGPILSAYATMPKLADIRIIENRCLPYMGPECGACAHSCPVEGALLWDGPKPRIDPETCVGCAMCVEACITEPKAVSVRSLN